MDRLWSRGESDSTMEIRSTLSSTGFTPGLWITIEAMSLSINSQLADMPAR